jgi:hypothetical protein
MQPLTAHALDSRRSEIKERWAALLRGEPVNTPLANPDTLVYLIDDTLDAVFVAIRDPANRRKRNRPPVCACGRNPFIAYFIAGKQALFEALVLAQAQLPALNPAERDHDADVLNEVIRTVIGEEIDSFGEVCQHRGDPSNPACAAAARSQESDARTGSLMPSTPI